MHSCRYIPTTSHKLYESLPGSLSPGKAPGASEYGALLPCNLDLQATSDGATPGRACSPGSSSPPCAAASQLSPHAAWPDGAPLRTSAAPPARRRARPPRVPGAPARARAPPPPRSPAEQPAAAARRSSVFRFKHGDGEPRRSSRLAPPSPEGTVAPCSAPLRRARAVARAPFKVRRCARPGRAAPRAVAHGAPESGGRASLRRGGPRRQWAPTGSVRGGKEAKHAHWPCPASILG